MDVCLDFVATDALTHTLSTERLTLSLVEQSTQNVHLTNMPLRTTHTQARGYKRQAGSNKDWIRFKALNND